MKSTLVVYTDTDDLCWIVAVPENTAEEDYDTGIVLGPPDLASLQLPHQELVTLQQALVEKCWYIAPQLMGQRKALQTLLKDLKLPVDLYRKILHLYQVSYYGE